MLLNDIYKSIQWAFGRYTGYGFWSILVNGGAVDVNNNKQNDKQPDVASKRVG